MEIGNFEQTSNSNVNLIDSEEGTFIYLYKNYKDIFFQTTKLDVATQECFQNECSTVVELEHIENYTLTKSVLHDQKIFTISKKTYSDNSIGYYFQAYPSDCSSTFKIGDGSVAVRPIITISKKAIE